MDTDGSVLHGLTTRSNEICMPIFRKIGSVVEVILIEILI